MSPICNPVSTQLLIDSYCQSDWASLYLRIMVSQWYSKMLYSRYGTEHVGKYLKEKLEKETFDLPCLG